MANILRQLKFIAAAGGAEFEGADEVPVTLPVGDYYAEFGLAGTEAALVVGLQIESPGALVGSFLVDRTNRIKPTAGAATGWINNGAAAVPVTAGSAQLIDWKHSGALRERIKLTVTTQGTILAIVNMKGGW
jgi:hypothetical protein